MTRQKAIKLAAKWAEGVVCTLREGEAREYHKLCLDALRAQQERENQKPLTLKELREMDGDPVYIVENTEYWSIVNGFNRDGVYLLSYGNPDDFGSFDLYGKAWLAYRHKPEPPC